MSGGRRTSIGKMASSSEEVNAVTNTEGDDGCDGKLALWLISLVYN